MLPQTNIGTSTGIVLTCQGHINRLLCEGSAVAGTSIRQSGNNDDTAGRSEIYTIWAYRHRRSGVATTNPPRDTNCRETKEEPEDCAGANQHYSLNTIRLICVGSAATGTRSRANDNNNKPSGKREIYTTVENRHQRSGDASTDLLRGTSCCEPTTKLKIYTWVNRHRRSSDTTAARTRDTSCYDYETSTTEADRHRPGADINCCDSRSPTPIHQWGAEERPSKSGSAKRRTTVIQPANKNSHRNKHKAENITKKKQRRNSTDAASLQTRDSQHSDRYQERVGEDDLRSEPSALHRSRGRADWDPREGDVVATRKPSAKSFEAQTGRGASARAEPQRSCTQEEGKEATTEHFEG